MRQGCVFIYRCCRLGAKVGTGAFEIERTDTVLAECACEFRATIHWFVYVISHILVVVPPLRALIDKHFMSVCGSFACFQMQPSGILFLC
jgi:hypothetical protein